MERWLLIAETSCIDPSREKEFNHRYDNIHVPDILETPGFIRATRYENSMPAEDRGKFLALYEVETENLPQTMAAFTENVTRKWQEGRMSELLKPISAILCRHTFAINYLLNGGDIFTLQEILGHTTLEMVRHYVHFTSSQVAAQHHKYSPIDKLHIPEQKAPVNKTAAMIATK